MQIKHHIPTLMNPHLPRSNSHHTSPHTRHMDRTVNSASHHNTALNVLHRETGKRRAGRRGRHVHHAPVQVGQRAAGRGGARGRHGQGDVHAAVVGEGDVARGGEAGLADAGAAGGAGDFGVVVSGGGGRGGCGGEGADGGVVSIRGRRLGRGSGSAVVAPSRARSSARHRVQAPGVGLGLLGGRGGRGALLKLEAVLGGELGGRRVDLVRQGLDNVRVSPLVVGGDVFRGVGDLQGEARDAAQDVLDRILALAADGCEGRELADLVLDGLRVAGVSWSAEGNPVRGGGEY